MPAAEDKKEELASEQEEEEETDEWPSNYKLPDYYCDPQQAWDVAEIAEDMNKLMDRKDIDQEEKDAQYLKMNQTKNEMINNYRAWKR